MIARLLPAAGLDRLQEQFDVVPGKFDVEPVELRERIAGASALVADPGVVVDAALLDAAGSSLEAVANFAVGYDNIDLDACRERDVIVTNTPDVLTNATAELTLGLILATTRRLGEGERQLRAGEWKGWDASHLLGLELSESTIGLVGVGRIGTRVAQLLQSFDAKLLYNSRTPKPELEAELGLERRELDELVAEADIVTLHVPLTEQTRYLVDQRLLARFKPGSVLINTTRGAVVDTNALISALRGGPPAAAGLDVYEDEPNVPDGLIELENVVLLPHLGSATSQTRDAMATLAAENVIAVLTGEPAVSPVEAD